MEGNAGICKSPGDADVAGQGTSLCEPLYYELENAFFFIKYHTCFTLCILLWALHIVMSDALYLTVSTET